MPRGSDLLSNRAKTSSSGFFESSLSDMADVSDMYEETTHSAALLGVFITTNTAVLHSFWMSRSRCTQSLVNVERLEKRAPNHVFIG